MKPSYLFSLTLFLFVLLIGVPKVLAAAPDGVGPWADSVVSANQGKMKNGGNVPAIRSNPSAAVGVAEGTIADGTFYSLGFGGSIVLGFVNGISGGVLTVESTNPGYPKETAKVEVSQDGSHWVLAGSVIQSGTVTLPRTMKCAKYVRLTDTSDKNIFSDGTADGYDVDGVRSVNDTSCKPNDGGDTTVIIKNDSNCTISQGNVMGVTTVQTTVTNTGGNTIKNTTGGSGTIQTGVSTSTTKSVVTGGANIVNGACPTCCCTGGSINVTISGNGASLQ